MALAWPTGNSLFALQVLSIIAAAMAIFWPVLRGDWLWDDYIDISQNQVTRSATGLWSIWFEPGSQPDYYPVKATVQWVQWHLWGDDTLGYHLTNLVLHIISALLAWRLFSKLGLRLAWLAGLIFVLHPAQVESVAWIAELKNTLSFPLFALAICFYLDYDERGLRRDYLFSLGLFLAAMLTKPTMVMFPVVILLHAWWKRGRVGLSDLKISAPFFLLSLVLGGVTLWMNNIYPELHHVAGGPMPLGGFFSRLALAGLSLTFYLAKAVLPVGLLPIYPQWPVSPPAPVQFFPWLAFVVAFAACWIRRKGWGRHVLFGLGFFLVMLFPFVGFIGANYMRFTWVMDHFLYIPILGVIGLEVAGLEQLGQRLEPAVRYAGGVALAVVLAVMAWGSGDYAAQFVNEETLWTYTLSGNPSAWPAHVNLGNMLAVRGRYDDAIGHFKETLRLHPGYAEAESNWGTILFELGHPDEAVEHYQRAIRLDPDFDQTYYDWAVVLVQLGHPDQAILKFEKAIELKPESAAAHNNFGVALSQLGRKSEAAEQFKEALRLDPSNQGAATNLRKLEEAKSPAVGK
jgi:tetratricopeptide (TPR) repeat protein